MGSLSTSSSKYSPATATTTVNPPAIELSTRTPSTKRFAPSPSGLPLDELSPLLSHTRPPAILRRTAYPRAVQSELARIKTSQMKLKSMFHNFFET
ncbi:hypothetical protein V2J09_016791 [Rumex salicifolius]